jgi:hypothetical protein
MSKAVITTALLRIGKHGVSLGSFFESFFGVRIALVLVRVMLVRQTPVSALEILLAG